MKLLIIVFFSILISASSFAENLSCTSETKVDGWIGGDTYDYLLLESQFDGENLSNPLLSGAYGADYRGTLSGVLSQNGKWIKFRTLEDAWCWYTVTLPVNRRFSKEFVGFVDRVCEEGHGRQSIRLNCSFKR